MAEYGMRCAIVMERESPIIKPNLQIRNGWPRRDTPPTLLAWRRKWRRHLFGSKQIVELILRVVDEQHPPIGDAAHRLQKELFAKALHFGRRRNQQCLSGAEQTVERQPVEHQPLLPGLL